MLEYTTYESKRLVKQLCNAYIENPTVGYENPGKSQANVLAQLQS